MPQTILITGGTGFFGINAARYLINKGHTVILTSITPERYKEDFSPAILAFTNILNPDSISHCIKTYKPDYIIHAAALSQPGVCEKQPDEAYNINVTGTKNVLHAAQKESLPLVYLSTDLVFNGNKPINPEDSTTWYSETDTPDAHIVYGKSKRSAELHILDSAYPYWIIARPTLMFGTGTSWTNGFPQFAVSLLQQQQPTTLFLDQFRTPVYIPDLISALDMLIQKRLFREIFHIGGPERINRVDFVRRYCHRADIPTATLQEVSMYDIPGYTTIVRDVSLNSSKIMAMTNWKPSPLNDSFGMMSKNSFMP